MTQMTWSGFLESFTSKCMTGCLRNSASVFVLKKKVRELDTDVDNYVNNTRCPPLPFKGECIMHLLYWLWLIELHVYFMHYNDLENHHRCFQIVTKLARKFTFIHLASAYFSKIVRCYLLCGIMRNVLS